MQSDIFDKTDKGREEIISRKYHLSGRLRALLVLVNGMHNNDDLLEQVAALGLTQSSIEELEQQGFIQRQSQAIETMSHHAETPAQQLNNSDLFQSLHHFYTEAIKQNLGLRGHNIQLIVERASTLQDFYHLRTPFLDAVNKSQSEDKSLELRHQLDELLNLIPIIP